MHSTQAFLQSIQLIIGYGKSVNNLIGMHFTQCNIQCSCRVNALLDIKEYLLQIAHKIKQINTHERLHAARAHKIYMNFSNQTKKTGLHCKNVIFKWMKKKL